MLAALQISGRILAPFSQKKPKGGRIFKCFFSCIFPIWNIKNLEFSQILVLVWFQNFSNILMKWNQSCCYLYKGAELFAQRPNFWDILAENFWKELATLSVGQTCFGSDCRKAFSSLKIFNKNIVFVITLRLTSLHAKSTFEDHSIPIRV
jgi:hypothetical protein